MSREALLAQRSALTHGVTLRLVARVGERLAPILDRLRRGLVVVIELTSWLSLWTSRSNRKGQATPRRWHPGPARSRKLIHPQAPQSDPSGRGGIGDDPGSLSSRRIRGRTAPGTWPISGRHASAPPTDWRGFSRPEPRSHKARPNASMFAISRPDAATSRAARPPGLKAGFSNLPS